jgi:hypothetical protein
MTPKFCRGCKEIHDPLMSCSVAKRIATNASNTATNNATNANEAKVVLVDRGQPDVPSVSAGVGGLGRTSNRRSRETYNAYQREYMRLWRAVKAGRACLWPNGI